MKKFLLIFTLTLVFFTIKAQEKRIYHTSGGEVILSGADVVFNGTEVNNNMRFTLFFHTQQLVNLDLTNNLGLYTGLSIRNVGLIMEDLYQNVGYDVGNTDPNYNKTTTVKHRSYSLGFPLAVKVGSLDKNFFFYAGGEYEWMFAYKQKLFLDGQKSKFTEWNSDRVTTWNPSLFAGIQFPYGINLKFKYYLKDFLDKDFTGEDFGQPVDYSQFESSGIWYISVAFMTNWKQIRNMVDKETHKQSAYR